MRALARLCLPLACALSPATVGTRGRTVESRPRPPAARECAPAAREATAEAGRLRSEWTRESLRRAASQLDAAHRCWRLAHDEAAEADALSTLGEVFSALEEWERARASYESAARLRGRLGDARGAAEASCALSRALTGLRRFDEAVKSAQSALDTAHSLADPRLEARARSALGHAQYFASRPREALPNLERAAALAPPDDARTRAETLLGLGWAYSDAGELEHAFARFNEALPLWEKVGDPAGQARTLTALGRALTFRGERQSALEHHRRALRIAEASGDIETQAVANNNIGYFHESLGQPERALAPFERALAGFNATGNRPGQAVTLQYIGNVHSALGDRARARDFYRRGLALSRALNPLLEAYALNNIGLLEQSEGRAVIALDNFGRAREIYERAGNRRGHAYALANAGFALETLGRRGEALGSYERALSLIVSAGDRGGELFVRHNLARVLAGAGRLDEARAHCETSLELIERLRTKVASQEHRTSYFASVHRHYELYIDVLMSLAAARPGGEDFAALALQTSERARARTLLETLAEVSVGIRQGVDPALAERQRALQLRIDEASSRQTGLLARAHTEEEAASAARALRELLEEYDELRGEIRARSPHYAALVEPQPAGLAEARRLLDDDTLLVEFSLGERRSFVWAVTRDTFVARELPPRAEIEGAARGLLELLTARQTDPAAADFAGRERRAADADARYWREAGKLSRMILAPVAPELGRKRRLLVVADGALHLVPFDALPAPDQTDAPLMLDHEIANLPSVSTLAALRREGPARARAPGAVAVLADPVFERDDPRVRTPAPDGGPPVAPDGPRPAAAAGGRSRGLESGGDSRRERAPAPPAAARAPARLPASRDEAEAIMSVVPAGAGLKITGFDATRAAALNPELARYRVVHFATHGFFDEREPELSCVVFSLVDERGEGRDGYLRLRDIYNLNLPVELVVLSACETGRGRDVRGEGLVGLTRGFMYAGAGGVVASLWKVDDEATAELMRHFYGGLLREDLSPAAALRAARIKVWRERRWSAPYYWAAFVLQGEPGESPRAGAARAAWAGSWKRAAGVVALLAFCAAALYAFKRRGRKNLAAPAR
ncbi:MAG: CHAT domain-containing protein [Acidobacteria bacterium]|nr:CHAT domain-containing protein [Acidobacteriota bacterium]